MEAVAAPEDLIQACSNIGPAERAKRVRIGVAGTALAVLTAAALLVSDAPGSWRLLLGLPVAVAAMGFLQARANLCVAFAGANIKVMGDSPRDRVAVTSEAERAAFRKKAQLIYLQAVAVTGFVVGLFLLLP